MKELIVFIGVLWFCLNLIGWVFILLICGSEEIFPYTAIIEIMSCKNMFGKILMTLLILFFLPSIIFVSVLMVAMEAIDFIWNLGNKM